MLEHRTSERPEHLAEDLSGLLDSDVDDPLKPVPKRMVERESQRDQRLSVVGRHSQSKHAGRFR